MLINTHSLQKMRIYQNVQMVTHLGLSERTYKAALICNVPSHIYPDKGMRNGRLAVQSSQEIRF
jgi:hypothetical protein